MPMQQFDFLQPRLTGNRFDGNAIPLEFLRDLAVLQEMIFDVARAEFLKDNPGRARVPRGFSRGIELQLQGVGQGSARPRIVLVAVTAASTMFPNEIPHYYARAREAVVGAVRAAEEGGAPAAHLAPPLLAYFQRLGRSLQDGEAMTFDADGPAGGATLTKKTRRTLILASSSDADITEETTVRGTITEFDKDAMTFQLQLIDGRKITVPVATEHYGAAMSAFSTSPPGVKAKVLVSGIGTFTPTGTLRQMDFLDDVVELDPLDVPARLEELATLRAGWLADEEGIFGRPLHPEGVAWLADAFDANYPEGLPLPRLYPTAEGGVQAEWTIGSFEVSLEIDLKTKSSEWHALDLSSPASEANERSFDLGSAESWAELASAVRDLSGGVG